MATRMSAATRPAVLTTRQRHVVERFSFGVNASLLADVGAKGNVSAWYQRQWTPSTITDPSVGVVASWFPRLADTPSDAWAAVKSQERSAWDYGFDFSCFTIARKLTTRRQLQEVMADFWSNLLYIPAGEDRSFPWRFSYDKTIRDRSLLSYRQLLRAAVMHPAMSGWLNNNSNTKKGPNENLGRELLELFTVGRPAGYDEEDVKNSARLLTGFRVRVFDGYDATYDPAQHWTGEVKVLGFKHANSDPDGRPALLAYLDYLARHPATAERIARRLCQRFVSDTPSRSIVSAVASAYRKADTGVKATMQALVAHPDFQKSYKGKMRTPLEDVISSARVLGMRPTGVTSDASLVRHLHWMGSNLGQAQFGWPRPDGFPETGSTWGSPARVLRSWDTHNALEGNWWGSKDVSIPAPAASLPTAWPRTLDEIVEHQSRVLLGRPSSVAMRAGVKNALSMPGTRTIAKATDISDWAWTVIRATVLNHPEGMLR